MSDIFISYAAEDRDRVLPLVQALENTGWTIFWDRTIPAGKTWRQRMDAEIQACRSVLVVWTQNSVKSEWVLEEAEIGKRRQILIPVVLDEVEPPFGFGLIQAANLVGWSGNTSDSTCGRLISDIEIILGPAAAKGSEIESCRRLKEAPENNQRDERLRDQELPRAATEPGPTAETKQQSVPTDSTKDRIQAPAPASWGGRNGSLFLSALMTSAAKSSAWFRRIAGTFLATLIFSVTILVVLEISLGWNFAPAEVSVIVLFVWIVVAAGAALRSRSKRKRTDATD
jgi:hypothetical protein